MKSNSAMRNNVWNPSVKLPSGICRISVTPLEEVMYLQLISETDYRIFWNLLDWIYLPSNPNELVLASRNREYKV